MAKDKKIKKAVIITFLITAFIFAQAYYDVVPFLPSTLSVGVGSQFTPIFCNDYEFTCCNEIKNPSNPTINSISDESYYQCPTTATRCQILSVSASKPLSIGGVADWFVGSRNCRLTKTTFSGDYYECDNDVQHKLTMLPGDILFLRSLTYPTGANINGQAQIQVYDERLDFTGRASSTTGVPVYGADGCKFNPPGGKIYTSASLTNSLNTFSYTVPIGQCVLSWQGQDRHICGYREESCLSDSDCQGQVCTGRTLQTYGCKSYGSFISTTSENGLLVKGDTLSTASAGGDVADESQTISNTFGKRCEIVGAMQVQCCGDTDCGTNYRCDVFSHTCKPANQVSCSNDYDCGVSIQCDAFAKKLKTPICSFGTCSFQEVSIDCCSDENCASGYYCSVERKCEQKQAEKQICPLECCEDEERFFDKLCPNVAPFCIDGTCSAEPPELENCDSCDDKVISTMIGWAWKEKKCDASFLQGLTGCWTSWIKFILSFVALVFGTLFSRDFLNVFKQLRNSKGGNVVAWILAIGLGIGVAVLLFKLFWVGIFVFIFYFIFKIVIKFTPLGDVFG